MRTYYCVEMGVASYPVHTIHCQTRPFADPLTNRTCQRVRANSKAEAEKKVSDQLMAERFAACEQQFA